MRQLTLALNRSDYDRLRTNQCLLIKQTDLIDYGNTTVLDPPLMAGDSILALEKGEEGLTGHQKAVVVKDFISGVSALAKNYSLIITT